MAKKKNEKKQVKEKNNNRWFKEFKAELKKVVWPSKKDLLENTVVVLSMVIIVAAIIFVLDLAFESLNKLEVKQVQKMKNTTEVVQEADDSSDEVSDSDTAEITTSSEEDSSEEEATE